MMTMLLLIPFPLMYSGPACRRRPSRVIWHLGSKPTKLTASTIEKLL